MPSYKVARTSTGVNLVSTKTGCELPQEIEIPFSLLNGPLNLPSIGISRGEPAYKGERETRHKYVEALELAQGPRKPKL